MAFGGEERAVSVLKKQAAVESSVEELLEGGVAANAEGEDEGGKNFDSDYVTSPAKTVSTAASLSSSPSAGGSPGPPPPSKQGGEEEEEAPVVVAEEKGLAESPEGEKTNSEDKNAEVPDEEGDPPAAAVDPGEEKEDKERPQEVREEEEPEKEDKATEVTSAPEIVEERLAEKAGQDDVDGGEVDVDARVEDASDVPVTEETAADEVKDDDSAVPEKLSEVKVEAEATVMESSPIGIGDQGVEEVKDHDDGEAGGEEGTSSRRTSQSIADLVVEIEEKIDEAKTVILQEYSKEEAVALVKERIALEVSPTKDGDEDAEVKQEIEDENPALDGVAVESRAGESAQVDKGDPPEEVEEEDSGTGKEAVNGDGDDQEHDDNDDVAQVLDEEEKEEVQQPREQSGVGGGGGGGGHTADEGFGTEERISSSKGSESPALEQEAKVAEEVGAIIKAPIITAASVDGASAEEEVKPSASPKSKKGRSHSSRTARRNRRLSRRLARQQQQQQQQSSPSTSNSSEVSSDQDLLEDRATKKNNSKKEIGVSTRDFFKIIARRALMTKENSSNMMTRSLDSARADKLGVEGYRRKEEEEHDEGVKAFMDKAIKTAVEMADEEEEKEEDEKKRREEQQQEEAEAEASYRDEEFETDGAADDDDDGDLEPITEADEDASSSNRSRLKVEVGDDEMKKEEEEDNVEEGRPTSLKTSRRNLMVAGLIARAREMMATNKSAAERRSASAAARDDEEENSFEGLEEGAGDAIESEEGNNNNLTLLSDDDDLDVVTAEDVVTTTTRDSRNRFRSMIRRVLLVRMMDNRGSRQQQQQQLQQQVVEQEKAKEFNRTIQEALQRDLDLFHKGPEAVELEEEEEERATEEESGYLPSPRPSRSRMR